MSEHNHSGRPENMDIATSRLIIEAALSLGCQSPDISAEGRGELIDHLRKHAIWSDLSWWDRMFHHL